MFLNYRSKDFIASKIEETKHHPSAISGSHNLISGDLRCKRAEGTERRIKGKKICGAVRGDSGKTKGKYLAETESANE